MFHLRKFFSEIEIPEPDNIYVSYYENATHCWKPAINSYEIYDDIIHPFKNDKIYIVGEAYAQTQQWLEGALETVNYLIDNII